MKLSRRRGQALLLVMWAMFIMSFSIMGLVQLLRVNIGTASSMERVAIASSLAHAGVTMGRNVDFPVTGRPERQKFANGSELEVIAVSENSKLNINNLLGAQDRVVLRSLFRLWGLSDVEADTVLDCLLDYVEPGDTRRLNGAKGEQYRKVGRRPPPGRPFRSIEEMSSVLNFDLVARRKPNWREYFTIYSDGKLDLSTAPADLIKAVCRIGDSGARAVLQKMSSGAALPSLDETRLTMGLTEKEFGEVRDRLSVGGSVRRVRATGTLAQAKRAIEAIYRLDGNGAIILDWKEW
jgi:type II secretory pathway component PulK